MPTFAPPGITVVPPVNEAETRTSPRTMDVNRQGYNLMRYFPERNRGVNVWKLDNGTYMMSDEVPGVTFTGTVAWPYPDTLDPVNDAISSSWYPGGVGGVGGSGPGGDIQHVPYHIVFEYLGGHSYTVSSAEAAALTAVGLGSFIT